MVVAGTWFNHHIADLFAEVLEAHHLIWQLIVLLSVVGAWYVLQFGIIGYFVLLKESWWVLLNFCLYNAWVYLALGLKFIAYSGLGRTWLIFTRHGKELLCFSLDEASLGVEIWLNAFFCLWERRAYLASCCLFYWLSFDVVILVSGEDHWLVPALVF